MVCAKHHICNSLVNDITTFIIVTCVLFMNNMHRMLVNGANLFLGHLYRPQGRKWGEALPNVKEESPKKVFTRDIQVSIISFAGRVSRRPTSSGGRIG